MLDANLILDYVQDGPGASTLERLLGEVSRRQSVLLMSALNMGEVSYWLWRNQEQGAQQTLNDLALMPIQIVPVDLGQALRAGELKARHRMPFVDCIAAALALERGATLVTADRDFERLGRSLAVIWVRR